MERTKLGWRLIGPILILIGLLTLIRDERGVLLPHWCFKCGGLWLSDFTLNAILFVPLGAALALITGRTRKSIGIAAAVSLAIEVAQRFLIQGRVASTGDLFSNTAGAAVGVAVTLFATALVWPDQRTARRLAISGSAVWLALVYALSVGTQKSISDRDLWGQWAPELGHLDHFRGNLLNGTLGNDPFPWNRADDSHRLRADLMGSDLHVTATVIPAAPTERIAPILSIFDASYAEVILLGQRGTNGVFRFRTRSADHGLLVPEVVLPDAFPGWFTSTPLTLAAAVRGSEITISGERAGEQTGRVAHLSLGPAVGWMLLVPGSGLPRFLSALLSATWLGVMLFPAAFWAAAARDGRRTIPAGTAVVAAGLYFIPSLLGVAPAPLSTWAGTAVLLASAAGVARALRGERPRLAAAAVTQAMVTAP